jgi:hypothetical protein
MNKDSIRESGEARAKEVQTLPKTSLIRLISYPQRHPATTIGE